MNKLFPQLYQQLALYENLKILAQDHSKNMETRIMGVRFWKLEAFPCQAIFPFRSIIIYLTKI